MKQHKPILSAFLILFLLLVSCTQDDAPLEIIQEEQEIFQTTNPEDILNLFQPSNTEGELTFSVFGGENSNSAFVVPDLENVRQEQLRNSNAFMTVIPATIPSAPSNVYSRVLALNANDEMHTAVLSMVRDDSNQDNGFNGYYFLHSLEGNLIHLYKVESGVIVKRLADTNTNQVAQTTSQEIELIENKPLIATSTGANCVCSIDNFSCCEFITEVYLTGGGGSPNTITPIEIFEPSNLPDYDPNNDSEPITYLTGGGGSGGSNGDGNDNNTCGPNAYFDTVANECKPAINLLDLLFEIDVSDLTGKEKCAYDLLAQTNGNLFNETIGLFGIPGAKYNLKFTYGSCNTGGEACTNTDDLANNNLTIKIADKGLSVLEQAANILHEGIHAEIYRYVKENGGSVDPNDRINLYNKYNQYNVQNGSYTNTSVAQHQHMADRFVYPIARAIRELDGLRLPVEDYLPFAWAGLEPYGVDGYFDENINFVHFVNEGIEIKIKKIVDETMVGNDCVN
ncbi:hypothetical protein D7030_01305 [Flavobacteriaceae bacterium AU392]|nr:hypothetical protein D1817_07760 [Flavobacteriaceae bacterium]RKM86516.1 hypothetical protein D7030_01305 [Flavobacteriaceae bacterium AU392]